MCPKALQRPKRPSPIDPTQNRPHDVHGSHSWASYLYSFSVIRRLAALSRTMFSISSEKPSTVSAAMSSTSVIVVPRARSSSLSIDWAMLLRGTILKQLAKRKDGDFVFPSYAGIWVMTG